MIRNDRGESLKPEKRDLRQNLSLARNAVGHDAIERRNPVRGHQQQPVAEIKHFADFAAFDFSNSRQINLQQRLVHHAVKCGAARINFKSFRTGTRRAERDLQVA
jgi:hypothetical protein